ncbi:hypothetical protein ACIQJT_35415 [Streptomyces sp. NPDC091972]|uniref:hypothetical protein n=1 Tax=Streptomyces sp. NPDC091972 TaxID=3366007 RepID=UPI003802D5A4
MGYAAQYRQAMEDGATDSAHSIVVSAAQAAEAGGVSPEALRAFVDEMKENTGSAFTSPWIGRRGSSGISPTVLAHQREKAAN